MKNHSILSDKPYMQLQKSTEKARKRDHMLSLALQLAD